MIRKALTCVVLDLAACRAPPPPPHPPPPPAAPWAQVQPTRVEEILSTKEPMKAFAFGDDVLVVRHDEKRFRIAKLKNGALVDEEGWSRGLPATKKCNHVAAIFGRFPDRLWLVENAGGSHECESTFGTFVIWRRTNGTWTKDKAHSPSDPPAVAGIFATWPLGPAALGFGISNLVGDTLSLPEDVMWPASADPWKTHVRVRREGAELAAICGSTNGTVAMLSYGAGKPVLETISPDGSKATFDVPQAHAPDGPCAISEKDVLLAKHGAAWTAFDRTTRTWTSIAAPWPHRTERIDVSATRIIVWTADPKGHKHVFLGKRDGSTWTELSGLPDVDLDVVSTGDDEVLLLVDNTKLVRVGLPRP